MRRPDASELAVLERPFMLLSHHGLMSGPSDEAGHVVGTAPQSECVPVRSVVEGEPAQEPRPGAEVLFHGGEVAVGPLCAVIADERGVEQRQRSRRFGAGQGWPVEGADDPWSHAGTGNGVRGGFGGLIGWEARDVRHASDAALASLLRPSPVSGGRAGPDACHPEVVAVGRGAEQGVVRWCASASKASDFSAGLLTRLGDVIGFEGAFLASVDPATLVYTRAFRHGMPPEASGAFLAAEFGVEDVNQLRQLVRRPSPVGWLDQATGGDRMVAGRYREAMLPYGLGDELRVALLADGTCWGLLCLHRAQARAGFDALDAARLGALAPHVASALRRTVLIEQASYATTGDGPGVAMLNSDGTVRSSTPAGARWLVELADLDRPRTQRLPTVVASVVERLTSADGGNPRAARARVCAPSGQWLTVHASRLDDAERSVAVVVEPTSPVALAPLLIAAYGLTARESEVTRRLLTGLARKTIASELRISVHTVNDYVKAVFEKTGASSAGQLRAQVFRDGTAGVAR